MSDLDLYNFSRIFEDPIAEILIAAGLQTATPRNTAQFQAIRPRIEIQFNLGAEKASYHVLPNGEIRNASWFSTLDAYLLTASGDNGADGQTPNASDAHLEYRAKVHNVFSTLKRQLNGARANGTRYLPCHEVQRINLVSADIQYRAASGYEASKMPFNLEFGIQYSAWAELGNPATFPSTTVP